MTQEDLQSILKLSEATASVDDWHELPEGRTVTVQVASNGVGLSISRGRAIRHASGHLHVRTDRDELFVVRLGDVFAFAFDGSGRSVRRAGFA